MSTVISHAPGRAPNPALAVLLAGGVAATFDIVYACSSFVYFTGRSPVIVLQAVASGLLGPASFQGGATSAAIGLIAHYAILFIAAAMYVAASRRIAFTMRHPVVSGLLFGAAIYVVMNYVIVPLSAAPKFGSTTASTIGQIVVHLFLIGLPIALITRRVAPKE